MDLIKRLDFCNPAFVKLWDLDAGWLRDKPEFGEILEDKIEDLPEIKQVDIRGAQNKEVEVAVDPYRMAASKKSV